MIFGQEVPFEPGWKASAAAAAQARVLDERDNLGRLLLFEQARKSVITAVGAIALEPMAIRLVDARQECGFKVCHTEPITPFSNTCSSSFPNSVWERGALSYPLDQRIRFVVRDVQLVLVIHQHARSPLAS